MFLLLVPLSRIREIGHKIRWQRWPYWYWTNTVESNCQVFHSDNLINTEQPYSPIWKISFCPPGIGKYSGVTLSSRGVSHWTIPGAWPLHPRVNMRATKHWHWTITRFIDIFSYCYIYVDPPFHHGRWPLSSFWRIVDPWTPWDISVIKRGKIWGLVFDFNFFPLSGTKLGIFSPLVHLSATFAQ